MRGLLGRLLQARFKISVQLYLGLTVIVAFTIGASLIAWLFFNRMGAVQRHVAEGVVPGMAAAFAVARQSVALVDAAPRLAAATTPAIFAEVSAGIEEHLNAFETQMSNLFLLKSEMAYEDKEEVERLNRIHILGQTLTSNTYAIKESVATKFTLTESREALRSELLKVQKELADILVPAIDSQWFYIMTGHRELKEPPSRPQTHFSKEELEYYRHLSMLYASMVSLTEVVANALNLSDAALLEPLKESFEVTMADIGRSLIALGSSPIRRQISPAFSQLFELGLGAEGSFELHSKELELAETQQALLTQSRSLEVELVAEIDNLVETAGLSAQNASHDTEQVIRTGRSLLLFLNIASIAGAALIAWLFIGRILLRRLELLSNRMRSMAEGDLETKVNIGGRDEVAEMASALEIFRRNALEVQRLNLVEKLAEDLRDKNSQLETTLEDLNRMQDQIVMREKLASLGELTAGVAHEIKNPLNFVKNFAEASEELLEELEEILEKEKEVLSEEQRELIDEICRDLTENLERIRNHSSRADRIVRDMLMMGRGSSDRQLTDINNLLEEHAWLAFHSARATDSDFQLEIKQDLDPDVGELEVIPQDMGRLFLNMVSNACHATDKRRRAAQEEGKDYAPIMSISTKRLPEHIEVRVRDNGTGIPPDIIKKIFNPFFTTKPTDQGTGLGLALSNDIAREHGATIQVESELGSFTEMIITIPMNATPDVTRHDEPTDDEPTDDEPEDDEPTDEPVPSEAAS